jgi:ribonuclease E
VTTPEAAPVAEATPAAEEKAPSRRKKKEIPEGEIVVSSTAAPAPVETPETTAEEPKPKKVGWWQRRLGLG